MIDTTTQFLNAIESIRANGVSYNALCAATGIDRRNLMRLVNDPVHHYPRPQWLTSLCIQYKVSPDYLILAEGNIYRHE